MERIREVPPDEAPMVALLVRDAFAEIAEQFGLTPQNCPSHPAFCTADRIIRDWAEGTRFFVLEDEELVYGCVGLSVEGERCWLSRLAVPPDFRHRGYGERLVDYVQAEARQLGLRRIDLSLIAENRRLSDWYLRLGFVENGTERFEHLPFTVGFMYRDCAQA